MDSDLAQRLTQLRSVIAIGQARGWPVPAEHDTSVELARAAQGVIDAPTPTPPPMPVKPAAVAQWISTVAADRRRWSDSRLVAEELYESAQRGIGRAGESVINDYITRIVDTFDTLGADFARLTQTAPRTLTGHEDAQQLADHSALLRTVGDLTRAALDRGQLAAASGEGADLGATGALWLYLQPAPDASIEAILGALRDTQGVPATLDQWATLNRIGLRCAREGEAADRQTKFIHALNRRGQQPHGGMHDESWAAMTEAA